MRRCALWLSLFATLAGCASPEGPPIRDEEAIAVTVDGFPVDCLMEQTVRVGATAEVSVAGGEDAMEIWLGARDVTADFAGEPLGATLSVPPDALTRLRVSRAGTFACTARLAYLPGVDAALEGLRGESATEVNTTRSDETGAPANVTLRAGTTGSTPSERAADFLARHAEAFGAPASQLVETEVSVAPDAWAVVSFAQVIDGVPGHRAGLDLEMDPEGVVVSVHARLFVGVDAAPSFDADEEAVRAAASEAGEISAVTRVIFDPASPRAAWQVDGLRALVVIDDGTLEVLESSSTLEEATVEIHRPTPTPLPGSNRDGMTGHRRVAAGSSAGGPPTGLTPEERQVWSWGARIAENVRARSGQDGWRATTHPSIPISQVGAGGVRFMMEPMSASPSAGWYSYGIVYLGTSSAREAAVVCHEYGHALHDTLRSQRPEAGPIKEAAADAFWIFCDPWITGRRRTGYRGQDFAYPRGRRDQTDYDVYRAAGLTADNSVAAGYDVHDHTYFLSVPFYRLVEVYDTPVERGEQLMYFTLGYNRASSTERFRQFRDAIVQQADAWARSGRHGYTSEDACNVARAFRDLKLDGEYGRGTDATCGGVGAGSTTRDDRYVCTTAYCPLCPVENPNPCARVPSPSEPHCVAPGIAGAGDRRICVGALALTDEGCATGELHHCWCQADGSWDCPGACRDPGAGVVYCPERGGGGGGFTRPTPSCAATDSSGGGWIALVLLFGGLLVSRRRR